MESYSAGAKIIGLALALEGGGGGVESSMQGEIHLHGGGGGGGQPPASKLAGIRKKTASKALPKSGPGPENERKWAPKWEPKVTSTAPPP